MTAAYSRWEQRRLPIGVRQLLPEDLKGGIATEAEQFISSLGVDMYIVELGYRF